MNIQITARHGKVTDVEKDGIIEDLEGLTKFSEKITNCHVIIDGEHVRKTVEVNLTVRGKVVSATAKGTTVMQAEGLVSGKLERQLKKLNQKVKSHKAVKDKDQAELTDE